MSDTAVLSESAYPVEPVGESLFVRIAGWVIGLLLGVVFGMLGTVVNQATITLFGASGLALGLVLAVFASLFLLVGLRLIMPTRTISLLAAVGLVGIVAVLTVSSPGGSVLIPANWQGYVWTFAPTVIALIVLAWPKGLGRAKPTAGQPIAAPNAAAAGPGGERVSADA